jgi:two-component system, response regulator PdtaR
MVDLKRAINTTLLLVDDDIQQLELRAIVLKMCGFSVITASGPLEAISIIAQQPACRADVAVVDYHMPVMNGCILAAYLRSRYPDMKIILCSGTVEIPESELSSVDVFVPKSDGIGTLLAQVAEFAQVSQTTHGAVLAREA